MESEWANLYKTTAKIVSLNQCLDGWVVEGARPKQYAGPVDLSADKLIDLADDERRLAVLKHIAGTNGSIEPKWVAGLKRGYAYLRSGDAGIDRRLDEDIRYLSRGDYIIASFHERVTRCPSCSAHTVNVREVCPSCGSSNLMAQPMLHHFRCGYVGPIETFSQDERGQWICPKCNSKLKNLGTDYEHAGDHYSCRSCFASFQDPNAEGFCLTCGTKTDGGSLDSEDVLSYRLSPLGAAAIRTGRLFSREDEQMMEGRLPIYRRRVMVSLMTDELRRQKRYKIDVTFMLLEVNYSCEPDEFPRREELFLKKLSDFLRDVDAAGRYAETSYVINLPATSIDGATVARRRLYEHFKGAPETLSIHLIDSREIDDVPTALRQVYMSTAATV